MSEARVTIVVDNHAEEGLRFEHGFSAWIEVDRRRVLFDTGQGPAIEANVDRLGLDLETADAVILSHGHYDHTGGVPFVVKRAPAAPLYAHRAAVGPHLAVRGGVSRSIGISSATRTAMEDHPGGVRWLSGSEGLGDRMGITGPVPRLTDFEDTGGPFFVDASGTRSDPIEDDLALWLRTDQGLVVVVGCSHSGVVNTLRYALSLSGEPRLHAVIGGFHLLEARERRLVSTMEALRELDPDLIVPCHCTGDDAVERLEGAFQGRVVPGCAGARYTFDEREG